MKKVPSVSNGVPNSAGKLRVVLQIRLHDGAQERFLAAYEQMRYSVAEVSGHLHDQLCQSTEDPLEWIITSEWETPQHFYDWERGEGHRRLVVPMHACVRKARSLRYHVKAETSSLVS